MPGATETDRSSSSSTTGGGGAEVASTAVFDAGVDAAGLLAPLVVKTSFPSASRLTEEGVAVLGAVLMGALASGAWTECVSVSVHPLERESVSPDGI